MKSEILPLHRPPAEDKTFEHEHFAKATDSLKHDHRVIEKVLAALERLAGASEIRLDVWKKAIDFLKIFADRCHHLKEEKILFPALEERGIPREGGPIGMMLAEHEEGRGYVRKMAATLALAEQDSKEATTALRETARKYLRLLREHIQKEDEVLFEMADGVLTPAEQENLLHEFAEHEAKEIGAGVHERYLQIAQELAAYSGSS